MVSMFQIFLHTAVTLAVPRVNWLNSEKMCQVPLRGVECETYAHTHCEVQQIQSILFLLFSYVEHVKVSLWGPIVLMITVIFKGFIKKLLTTLASLLEKTEIKVPPLDDELKIRFMCT